MNWQDWIGREQVQRDVLTAALLARFNATIDAEPGGRIAPQGIHWTLCTPEAATAELDVDGHPRRGGFLPPIPLPRRMWASSDVRFIAPIEVEASITRTSRIVSVEEKTGGSGTLVFVRIAHETLSNGVPAVSEVQTLVYREASADAPPVLGPGEPDLAAWSMHRAITPSSAMLFRYSALTFNSHRIHYDRPYAVDCERYRGLVVHGPLSATLLLDLAGRALGPNRLTRFAFRGVSPAIADETLHLVSRQDGADFTMAALGSDGRTVMTATATMIAA